MKRTHPDDDSIGYIAEEEANRMKRPDVWRAQKAGNDGSVYFVATAPQARIANDDNSIDQQHPNRRRVWFAEEHNKTYRCQRSSNSKEQWYKKQDYVRFAQEAKQLANQLNADNDTESDWARSLVRIYEAFHMAQTTQEIKPILLANHVSLPHDDWVGMEKLAIPTIGQISMQHRLVLWQQLERMQNVVAECPEHEREAWIRHAVERHSYVSLMFARYMAFLVAESRDT